MYEKNKTAKEEVVTKPFCYNFSIKMFVFFGNKFF